MRKMDKMADKVLVQKGTIWELKKYRCTRVSVVRIIPATEDRVARVLIYHTKADRRSTMRLKLYELLEGELIGRVR